MLIADEPTGSQDPRTVLEVIRGCPRSELAGESTVVVLTEHRELMRGWRAVSLGSSGYRR